MLLDLIRGGQKFTKLRFYSPLKTGSAGTAAVHAANVEERTRLTVGSVAELPYDEGLFDAAISINVGCNLPEEILRPHIAEMFRTLKPGGTATMTAPASFGILFTTGADKELVHAKIEAALMEINHSPSAERVTCYLNSLTEVLRATFAMREGALVLVTDEDQLTRGERIWRKIPGLTVPNFYHPDTDYEAAALEAGFQVAQVDRPVGEFSGLGSEFSDHNPFTILHLKKPA